MTREEKNILITRMSLEVARAKSLEDLKGLHIKGVAELKTERIGLEIDHIFVFVTSSNSKCKGLKKFKVEELNQAVEYFHNRSQIKSKRLFISLGVDYISGAQDTLITGTDYMEVK